MRRCPRCGRYMFNHTVQIFGGAKLVYNCVCGYSTEEQSTGMYWSDTSGASSAGNMWDTASHMPGSRTYKTYWTPEDDARELALKEWGEALREYLKSGHENERLEELVSSSEKVKEQYRQMLNPAAVADMAAEKGSVQDVIRDAMYYGHLNMLIELYEQEEILRREKQGFARLAEEYPDMPRIVESLSHHRRLTLNELKEETGIKSPEIEQTLGSCALYFNIRNNGENGETIQVSLSQKGKRYWNTINQN